MASLHRQCVLWNRTADIPLCIYHESELLGYSMVRQCRVPVRMEVCTDHSRRQGTLFTIAIALFAVAFNTFAARHLPTFEGFVLLFHLIGFFAVMIPLWVLAPKVPASEVFGASGFANYGGWPSIGAACVIGQLAASSALLGADSAAHMSEEVCL